MIPQPNPTTGQSSHNRVFSAFFGRILLGVLAFQSVAQALFLDAFIDAVRVPDTSIKVDGRPDLIWKAISAQSYGASTLSFNDYRKIVLLEADSIRNADPSLYFTAPAQGSVTMLAAYDNTALYFFFLVKENTAFNPAALCSAANLWKADAPEVFVDPSPWNPTNYGAYFTVDGSGLLYGTSPKTVQLDKPVYAADTRFYFRDRTAAQNDRFQIPTAIPSGIKAMASAHSATDNLTVGVEMKIPFWTGVAGDFGSGKSMFISWGYNHYPDSMKTNCDANPIAYRWAKHYKTYAAGNQKPPGWRVGDSTHFDPTRSWDGWGRLMLDQVTVNTSRCQITDTASWDLDYWKSSCNATTGLIPIVRKPNPSAGARSLRDIQGRFLPSQIWTPVFPWSSRELSETIR